LSEAKVVPPLASESPSLLMANFLTEHPEKSRATNKARHWGKRIFLLCPLLLVGAQFPRHVEADLPVWLPLEAISQFFDSTSKGKATSR
jgi:hypothetical protein